MQQKRNGLPARHELKYFINPAELEALRARLRGALEMDRHCVGGRPYVIRSLYFDDIEDSAFYDKQAGVMHRLCDQLIDGNPVGLHKAQNPLLQDMYVQMRTRLLRPRVIVDYAREAYLHPAEDVRITFDLSLRSGLASHDLFNPQLPTVCPHDRNVEILEVKFNNYLPSYINALLSGVETERSAVSKYILCRRYEPLG